MDYYQIGQRIRKYRKAQGLSQEELAARAGISVTHMSHIETGSTKLSLPVLAALSDALDVRADVLLHEREGTVERVSREEVQVYPSIPRQKLRVALMDFGVKENMIRCLQARGCEVTVFPAHTTAVEILSGKFDGVMLSNGPGDPADNVAIIAEIRELYASGIPIFAVCLGHQLMALATGAETRKMRFGHRGANHPVKDLDAGRVFITSQNHGYVVTAESVKPEVAQVSHVNVNEGSVEGLRYTNGNVYTVQFHPEASPGPKDTEYLFDRFVRRMEGGAW